ncbi:hypothetical protein NEF87_000930 [Candidatus Lokiarchaeum ossiferum]|uniref:histidine kinase n=1 Tax=Candidatus Lokiarchaeum ossiferum TaxID=2951803 RepID=A0ABY6HMM5_9ARCH|nr:hypothetical protein NEF87_000930 [Candidatus Lokiarchaeum sp. B-35]
MKPTPNKNTTQDFSAADSSFQSRLKWIAKIQAEIVNNIPGFLVVMLDSDKKVCFMNTFACDMLGVNQDAILSQNWFNEFLPPLEIKIYEQKFEDFLAGKTFDSVMEYFLVAKDGTKFIVRWNLELLKDEQGKIVGLYCIGKDVTEKRIMQMELKHRIAMEQLITEISTTFLNIDLDQLDEKIQDLLANIGVFTNTNRSYLFLFQPSNEQFSLSHEWISKGFSSIQPDLNTISIKDFNRFYNLLTEGEIINIPTTKKISQKAINERLILQRLKINSFLCAPLIQNDKMYGFIGLDSQIENNMWELHDIQLLKTIANILVKVFHEKELLFEKEKLEKMFEKAFYSNQNLMIITSRKDYKFVSVNQSFLNAIGLPKEEVIGHSLQEFGVPWSQDQMKIISNQLDEKGRISYLILPFITGAGERRIGLYSMEAFSSNDSEYVLTSVIDVTDQKRIENELELYKRLIDTSDLGFVMYDLQGNIKYLNPAILKICEIHTPRDLFKGNIHEYYSEEYKRLVTKEIIPLVMQEGQWMGEITIKTALNHFVPSIQNIFLLSSNDKNSTIVANIVQDIREQKEVEQILVKKEKRFRTLAEKIPLPIAISDTNGNHLYLNPAFQKLFGYSLEEIPNTEAWMNLAYPNEEYRQSIYDYWIDIKAGKQKYQPKNITCKDGTIKKIIFREFPLADNELVSICEIFEDISE